LVCDINWRAAQLQIAELQVFWRTHALCAGGVREWLKGNKISDRISCDEVFIVVPTGFPRQSVAIIVFTMKYTKGEDLLTLEIFRF
jgi:hypothetical protein